MSTNLFLLTLFNYLALQEQYQFCYEMVIAYQAEFETYANFR